MIGRTTARPLSLFLLSAITVSTSIGLAYLIIPPESRDEHFLLTLISIVVAEILVFAYPIAEIAYGCRKSALLPFNIGMSTVTWFYAVGVVGMVRVAFLPVPFTILLVGHSILFLLLLWALGAWYLAGSHVAELDADRQTARKPMLELRAKCSSLLQSSMMLKGQRGNIVGNEIRKIEEDLKYCSSKSSEVTASLDSRIFKSLEDLDERVGSLKSLDEETFDRQLVEFLEALNRVRKDISDRELLTKATYSK